MPFFLPASFRHSEEIATRRPLRRGRHVFAGNEAGIKQVPPYGPCCVQHTSDAARSETSNEVIQAVFQRLLSKGDAKKTGFERSGLFSRQITNFFTMGGWSLKLD